jgi:predicted O-methyltransferase YrrM
MDPTTHRAGRALGPILEQTYHDQVAASKSTWDAVDSYINDTLVRPPAAFEQMVHRSSAAGLPPISVTAAQGKLLQLLARSLGAGRVLEIGTLGGYSAAWLASGLMSAGRVTTIEIDARHAQVARENLQLAGVADRVEVLVGRASDVLQKLAAERVAPFDLIFIDADKAGYPDYFRLSLKLARQGSLIVADNVVREGKVLEERSGDADVDGVRHFMQAVAAEPRASSTAIQTVGGKGYDGFALILID